MHQEYWLPDHVQEGW